GLSRRGGNRRRNRRCICACDRVEILPMPELEDDQAPEPQRVIAAARQVFANEAIDEPAIEISAFLRGARQQHIREEFAEVSSEPAADRYGKSLLAAIEDV